ncbi:hypothetical protein E4U37_003035, partial [Claviceps purpurea]
YRGMYSTTSNKARQTAAPTLVVQQTPVRTDPGYKITYLQTSTKPLKLSYAQPLERSPPPRIFPDPWTLPLHKSWRMPFGKGRLADAFH